VDNDFLVEYPPQISFKKICSIHFSSEDIKISISNRVSYHKKKPALPFIPDKFEVVHLTLDQLGITNLPFTRGVLYI
jgi:hypothetical protein